MGLHASVAELTGERDDFGDHKLSHAPGVAVRSIENRDTEGIRGLESHLIRADAESTDGEEMFVVLKNLSRQLGFGTDADDIGVLEPFTKLGLARRVRLKPNFEAFALEMIFRFRMNPFKQENAQRLLVRTKHIQTSFFAENWSLNLAKETDQ
jgi:hypothetical protein